MPIKIFERYNEMTWQFEQRINSWLSEQAAVHSVRNVYPNPEGDTVFVWYDDRPIEQVGET